MGARDLLCELTGAGFHVKAAGDKLVIRPASKLTDGMRAALRDAKPELMALLTGDRPCRLTPAEADVAHAEPWTEADIGRFTQRVVLFLRRGINATDADDLAERLHLRDLQGDDRRLCLECRHLSGRRCGNPRAAGIGRDLPEALVTQGQRCPGFGP
jgi:hypothetical protein